MNKLALALGLLAGKLNSKKVTKKDVGKILKDVESIYNEAMLKIKFEGKTKSQLFDINLNKIMDKLFEMTENGKLTKISHLRLLMMIAERSKYKADITALKLFTNIKIEHYGVEYILKHENIADAIKIETTVSDKIYQSPVFRLLQKISEVNHANLKKLKKTIINVTENWPASKDGFKSHLEKFQADVNNYYYDIDRLGDKINLAPTYDIINDKVYKTEKVKIINADFRLIELTLKSLFNNNISIEFGRKRIYSKNFVTDINFNRMFLFKNVSIFGAQYLKNDRLNVTNMIEIDIDKDLPGFKEYVLSNAKKWNNIDWIKKEFIIKDYLHIENSVVDKRTALVQNLIYQLALMILIDYKYNRKG